MYIVFSKHDLVFILKKNPAFILVYGLKLKTKLTKIKKKNNEKTNELEERHYARIAVGIQR